MKLANFKENNTLLALHISASDLENTKELSNCLFSIMRQSKKVDLVIFHNGLEKEELASLRKLVKKPVLKLLKNDEQGNPVEETVEPEKGESINCKIVKKSVETFNQFYNLGFNYANANEYEFYSVIEAGDVLAYYWIDTAEKYLNEDDELGIALPLVRQSVQGVYASMLNEVTWVEGMAEVAGVADSNLLSRYNALNLLGGVVRVSSLIEELVEVKKGVYAPIKESIKLSHVYEFFLRMAYSAIKIKSVPRIGYELKTNPKDSFNPITSKIPQNLTQIPVEKGGMSIEDAKYFIELANKEYYFPEDRGVEVQ